MTHMNTSVIWLEGVMKRFGGFVAVSIDRLAVDSGEVVGFVGVNGAGKTTTISMLLGTIAANEGTVQLFGCPVTPSRAHVLHKNIGYAAGDMELFDKLTGRQYLDFIRSAYGAEDKKREQSLCKRFEPELGKVIRTLSRGNKQKIALVAAFMTRPKLVVLDEPTSGLDPLMQAVFLDLVREEKANGTTVFMSSHILSEVADVCSRVVFIAHGKVVRDVTSQQLEEESGKRVRVVASGVLTPPKNARYIDSGKRGKYHELAFVHHGSGPELQAWVAGVKGLVDFYVADHSLEDAITELYGKETTV